MNPRQLLIATACLFATAVFAKDDDLDFLFEDTAPEQTSQAPADAPPAEPQPEAGTQPSADEPQPETSAASETDEPIIPDVVPVAPLREEPQPTVVAAPPRRQIEEIVVTAQKTEQSLQDVPLSVTALSGDFIKNTGAADLTDVAAYVPNVRVDTDDPGSPQVFIRGFGTNTFNPSFESSVGFVQDEVFFGRGGYFTESMFDIDRIEVLRGPQGTLFGKNTIAGVFNVTSAGPTEEFSGDARYTTGSYGDRRIEVGMGGMLTDWAGIRVSMLDRKSDGQLYNTYLNRDEEKLDQRAERLKLKLYASDSVDMELTVVDSDTSIAFWPYQLYKLDAGSLAYLRTFDPEVEDQPNDLTSMDTVGYLNKGSTTAGLKTSWAMGDLGGIQDFESVLVVGISQFYIDQLNDLDVSPSDIARLDSHEDHDQRTVELRFTGHSDGLFGLGDRLEFVSGLYYFDSDYAINAKVIAGQDLGSYAVTGDALELISGTSFGGLFGGISLPGLPLLGTITSPLVGDDYYGFDYTQGITAYAAFGQFTWYLNDHWAITPGIRLNRESKDVFAQGGGHCRTEALETCIMQALVQGNPYDYPNLRRNESDISPKFVLQYYWNDDLNFYTSYARGYKSGGFNAISFTGEDIEYEPETAQTYELGMKGKFFDSTLSLNTTLYRTEFDNLQVLAFNGFFFDVSNAASAYSQGLEADFMWLTPFEPLSISGSLGILDARYKGYDSAPAPYGSAQDTQDLSGKRIAFAPSKTATLTPTLSLPLFAGLVTQLSVDVLYQGDQYTDTDLDPNTYVDDYTMYSARISLSDEQGLWAVTFGGSNLTDRRVLNQVTDATFFPGTYFAQLGGGRQLFGSISINW
ncbi:TonB-dependent receptor [Sinimarinibacterium sp. CAU 1509]|uniref:TonB-dependent receptor n=1 Tax=Sinimarinibacterium sp. CAU 1509 TaxID=2562283 RepID=UPI0010ACBC48|nr:TonB-dependent receptor [Sinimarinibacterium sp. CAU 1509]TJY60822.1 TonB-dependent receptor [Sinimarinibacterium sp. CAU 1509]